MPFSLLLLALAVAVPDDRESDRQLLFADLKRRVGTEDWQAFEASAGASGFLRVLQRDQRWLRDLLDSGPVRRPNKVLSFLLRLWTEDPRLHRRDVRTRGAALRGFRNPHEPG